MRIVIKVGTQVIAGKDGLDQKKIGKLIKEIAFLQNTTLISIL